MYTSTKALQQGVAFKGLTKFMILLKTSLGMPRKCAHMGLKKSTTVMT